MPDLRDEPLCPDPIVSANLYQAGHLDQAIHGVAIPFWRDFRSMDDPDGRCYLWLMRYGVGGEHLKFRVHGPEALAESVRERLATAASRYLEGLEVPEEEAVGRGWQGAPPIDAEDATPEPHADRSFLWTTYRRSHVSLGDKLFLAEDRYAALFTRCLGTACDWILDALESQDTREVSIHQRRNSLFKLLITGLAVLDFSPRQRADYLAYHRDWVLRFCFPAENRFEVGYLEDLIGRCDRKTEEIAKTLAPLATVAQKTWSRPVSADRQAPSTDRTAAWQRSLADLLAYLRPLCADPAYSTDPFAEDPVFAPVFKVFHGAANQLGMDLFQEGFTHHLLRAVTTDDLAESGEDGPGDD
jgi:hypothetical protein